MTWYTFSVNGHRIVTPLSREQAEALGAEPGAEPADLAQRLTRLVRQLNNAASIPLSERRESE